MKHILPLFILALFAASPALAQSQSASAGRIENQISQPHAKTRGRPAVNLLAQPALTAPPAQARKQVAFTRIALDGVTAYREQDFARLQASDIGAGATLGDLYAFANDVSRKYYDDGYLLVRVMVPKNTAQDGVFHIRVSEGYLDRVAVTGAASKSDLALITGYMRRVRDQRPLDKKALERAMLLVNDIPGVNATADLTVVEGDPAIADITIDVAKDGYDAALRADNFGTRFNGRLQVSGLASENGQLGLSESLAAQATIAPDWHDGLELYYLGLAWDQPVSGLGTRLGAFLSYGFLDSGYTLDPINAEGRALHGAVTVTQPFIRAQDLNLTGRATLDFHDTDDWDDLAPTRRDRIRTARLDGRLEFADSLFRRGAASSLFLQVTQGIDGLGASDQAGATTRPGAAPDFTKIYADAQRLQSLTGSVKLLLGVTGQLASGQLLSAEEFSVGGRDYGRGFDPSDMLGDRGIAGKAELQWDRSAGLRLFDSYQLYAFADAGRVWNDSPAAFEEGRASLVSAGAGIRAQLFGMTDADLFVAQPLARDVTAEGDRDPRIFFSLQRSF